MRKIHVISFKRALCRVVRKDGEKAAELVRICESLKLVWSSSDIDGNGLKTVTRGKKQLGDVNIYNVPVEKVFGGVCRG